MMEKLNILAVDSTQFLQFVALKVMEIDQYYKGSVEIEELCQIDEEKLKRACVGKGYNNAGAWTEQLESLKDYT